MNYYNPNYYMGGVPYNQYTYASLPQQNTIPPSMAMTQNNVPQNTLLNNATLNGKIVDGEDVVKATEVPIGGYGIFPKADLSEIYLKTWNNNGTTSIITFQPLPVIDEDQIRQKQSAISNYELLEKINNIETKLDSLLIQPKQNISKQSQQTKTEVTNSGF